MCKPDGRVVSSPCDGKLFWELSEGKDVGTRLLRESESLSMTLGISSTLSFNRRNNPVK